MATHSFLVPHPFDFKILVIFSLKNIGAPLANIKRNKECQRWPEKTLLLGRSGTWYVAMVTKLLSSNCGAHLVESYYKESNIPDENWLRDLVTSYVIKIWLSV